MVWHYRAMVGRQIIMPKATVKLSSGATIVVEGTAGEVEDVVRRLSLKDGGGSVRQRSKKSTAAAGAGKAIGDYVIELRESGLFKKAQGLTDIKDALQADGHIVPITTLSGVMLSLVKSRELRRFKEAKTWKYVNR